MTIFQTFYQLTECLPISNGEDRVNMKSPYETFKHTNSYGLVSLPFLGLIQYYLERNDHSMTKNALIELYSNLSYIAVGQEVLGLKLFQI